VAKKVKKADDFGAFSGEPKTHWVGTGAGANRKMELLETFTYLDPDGKTWEAAMPRRVDGASIPRALWTIVGSPYTGCYRKASVVHDTACEDATTKQERKKADKMYYRACRCGGCSRGEAIIQYLGVRIGAWLPNVDMWQLASKKRTGRAAERRRTAADYSIVGTYYEILDEIGDPEEADFDVVVEIAERHLEAKARQLRRR